MKIKKDKVKTTNKEECFICKKEKDPEDLVLVDGLYVCKDHKGVKKED
jgi:hypothetical protein